MDTMLKYRGFPTRMTGTAFQFIIRRQNKQGATAIMRRDRYADRRYIDKCADAAFLAALVDYFGDKVFMRGNLDAGRLSWLFGREVLAAQLNFNHNSYQALLRIDMTRVMVNFPNIIKS